MYTRKSVFAQFVVGALCLQLLLAGCTLPPPATEETSGAISGDVSGSQSATTQDVAVNVAAMARLGETTQIEIEQFVETPSAGYETVAIIEDEAVIEEIVDTLDAQLVLQPRATCIESYHLIFTLESGTVHTFSYLCEGTPDSVLRGDVPFLADGDVRPSAQLQAIIEQQIAANRR